LAAIASASNWPAASVVAAKPGHSGSATTVIASTGIKTLCELREVALGSGGHGAERLQNTQVAGRGRRPFAAHCARIAAGGRTSAVTALLLLLLLVAAMHAVLVQKIISKHLSSLILEQFILWGPAIEK
jgi:hypothetical protein